MLPSLPPDLRRFAEYHLSQGNYPNEESFFAAAVVALREKQEKELRERLQAGISQLDHGEGIVLENDAAIDAFIDSLGTSGNE